jgi:hypothetical protein
MHLSIKLQGSSLNIIMTFIMQMSLVKSASFFQLACAHSNSYGHQHHCEKQTPYDIRGKSILLLGRQGACIYLFPSKNRVVNLWIDQLC